MRKIFKPGFTLLEILIATGIFMVIMVVSVGVFTLTVSGSSSVEQMRVTTQSTRFAFESIAREIKLAKGLVYAKDNVPVMTIPPFETVHEDTEDDKLMVYQVKKVRTADDGTPLYTITRRTYGRSATKELVLKVEKAIFEGADAVTAKVIYEAIAAATTANKLDGLEWGSDGSAGASILPASYTADRFEITRSYSYPDAGDPVDEINRQPFIQVEMTVQSLAYNMNKDTEKQVRTTLRTMIVPRSFDSPLEVVQPGISSQ